MTMTELLAQWRARAQTPGQEFWARAADLFEAAVRKSVVRDWKHEQAGEREPGSDDDQ